MRIKTISYTMPAIWASAVINLDYSGLEAADKAEMNNYLANEGLSFRDCLTCSDSYIGRFNGLLCEVADYTYKAV